MASTVSQTIEDIRSFRPMDIKFIQRCINDFLDEKYHNGIPNYMNYGAHIERCPKCGSVHFVKNGFDYNHKQKYRCKDCNTVFSATTGTMFSNSPVSFDTSMPYQPMLRKERNNLSIFIHEPFAPLPSSRTANNPNFRHLANYSNYSRHATLC